MKIPESIRIGGIEYAISMVPNLNDGEKFYLGQIFYQKTEIRLKEEASHESKCATLWHEILHGIAEHANLDLGEKDNEEKIVDVFAYGIYQVLQDNGQRLFDIVTEINKEEGK